MSETRFPDRDARLKDVSQIAKILNEYAKKGILLPRSMGHIYENLRDFIVVAKGDEILACGALHLFWEDLGEICSVAVKNGYDGRGLGTRVVKRLLKGAEELELERVFVLTYQESFFSNMGFTKIDKNLLPQKIWSDCLNCVHFPDCEEIAMIRYSGGS